jgi:integrase/recombinase XerD
VRWAREQLDPWLKLRSTLPVGALFCVLRGPTRGRPWSPAGVRAQLHVAAARAGRQLGHADLAITSVYLRCIDNTEIVHAVHERPAPMIPAHNRLNPSA